MHKGINVAIYNPNANKNIEPSEPIQEAIYDFGGANVKSCASIALSKSISKGLIPSGTLLPHRTTKFNVQQQNYFVATNASLYPAYSTNFRGS